MKSNVKFKGFIAWKLVGPDGQVKQEGHDHNLVVTEGDNWVANQLYGGTQAAMVQIALGTGTATPAKGDTWVTTPFSNNGAQAGTAGQVAVGTIPGTANGIRYVGTFGAGYATQNGIAEAVISNLAPGSGGSEPANGQILSHALLSPTVNKGASDELVITWDILFTGA